MNDAIKNLLTPQLKTWGGASDDNFSEELEKFAMLIVTECIGICEDTDGDPSELSRFGRHSCALEIRQHFGVEE